MTTPDKSFQATRDGVVACPESFRGSVPQCGTEGGRA